MCQKIILWFQAAGHLHIHHNITVPGIIVISLSELILIHDILIYTYIRESRYVTVWVGDGHTILQPQLSISHRW